MVRQNGIGGPQQRWVGSREHGPVGKVCPKGQNSPSRAVERGRLPSVVRAALAAGGAAATAAPLPLLLATILLGRAVIRLHNFLCSMLIFTPFV
jgi:hypothetical protein